MVFLQLSALVRPTFRVARHLPQRPLAQRWIASTSLRAAEATEDAATPFSESSNSSVESREFEDADSDGSAHPETYKEFLERIGFQYREASPQSWLAETPFPMNPSFRPPAPISDKQREAMYAQYMRDPVENNVRMLSQQYGLSIKRVDAILRLKGLEQAWKKGKQVQNGFQAGMDLLLGSTTHKATSASRYDVNQADSLEEDENRDALRQRYQRSYWESVPEHGSEPVVPRSVEHARAKAIGYGESADAFKANPILMPIVPNTPYMRRPGKEVVREREGRPTLRFVDVGAKFMDVNDRVKAIAKASQRSARRRRVAHAKEQAWRSELAAAKAASP